MALVLKGDMQSKWTIHFPTCLNFTFLHAYISLSVHGFSSQDLYMNIINK